MKTWRGAAKRLALMTGLLCLVIGLAKTQLQPAPPRSGGNPLGDLQLRAETLKGRVAEVHQAGHYTYIALDTASGARHWAVAMLQRPGVGDVVKLEVFGLRQDFRSRRLGRTFDTLRFVRVHPQEKT